jgi:hypothetical protein
MVTGLVTTWMEFTAMSWTVIAGALAAGSCRRLAGRRKTTAEDVGARSAFQEVSGLKATGRPDEQTLQNLGLDRVALRTNREARESSPWRYERSLMRLRAVDV